MLGLLFKKNAADASTSFDDPETPTMRQRLYSTITLILLAGTTSAAEFNRTSLPIPQPSFRGKVGLTPADSIKDFPTEVKAPDGAPNVLIILTDDVGFGASSTFGGPIPTPTFDRLAKSGLRYNQFHTTALCSPTRAALITGRTHHSVGCGVISELSTGFPGSLAISPEGWATVGDLGYVDEDGYLYLTDRKHFTIISGGVNIYPQEVENLLINHDKVADVAVFGVPHDEFGEEVKAVVQPGNWADATDEVAFELLEWLRERVSHLKVPRSIEFHPELPRMYNGKIYTRRLVEVYRGGARAGEKPEEG